jgi:hypothetical protein
LLFLFWVTNSLIALTIAPRIRLDVNNKYHWVMSSRAKRFDTALVGSSRVENCIDAVVFSKVTGKSCINLGAGGAAAVDQYLILHGFLKHNQVNQVLLQVDYLTLMNLFTYGFRDYEWLCYDDDPIVRATLIAERGSARYILWKAAPFLRLMEFSSQYRYFFDQQAPQASRLDATAGSVLRDFKNPPGKNYIPFSPDMRSIEYLSRIAQLCREKNIRLIVFQAPYPSTIVGRMDRDQIDDAIRSLCRAENVPFLDFSRVFYDRPELFCDGHHLTSHGAVTFSRLLGAHER